MATPTQISSPSDSLIITSPTLSASSLSSPGLGFVAVGQRNSGKTNASAGLNSQPGEESSFSDDDEIVWLVSENEEFGGGGLGAVDSDDDFVVLDHSMPTQSKSGIGFPTSGSAATLAGTGGIPPKPELEHQHFANNRDQGNSAAEGMAPMDEPVASELAKALASLTIDASGTKTPVKCETHDSELLGASPKNELGIQKDQQTAKRLLRLLRKNQKKKKERKEVKGDESMTVTKKEKRKGRATKGKAVESKKEKKSERETANGSTPAANPVSLPPSAPELARSMSAATLVPSSCTTSESPSSPSATAKSGPTSQLKKRKRKGKKGKVQPDSTSVIAEKVAEQTSNELTPAAYDEAVSYITSYISNASAHHDRVCHLTLLQSLAIELGLITDLALLPRSITSAKKFIKLRAFINVKEYLKKRDQGPEVVQGLLFPSRSALVKDMKQNKSFAPLKWIKEQGLQDLLVGVFHH